MKIPKDYFQGYGIVPCTVEFASGYRRCFRVYFPSGGTIVKETLWGVRRAIRKDARACYLIDQGVK